MPRATGADEGVYRFTRVVWHEEDLEHLFYIAVGAVKAQCITGQPSRTFDWGPDLVFDGTLVKVPESNELVGLIRERDRLRRKEQIIQTNIDEIVRKAKP